MVGDAVPVVGEAGDAVVVSRGVQRAGDDELTRPRVVAEAQYDLPHLCLAGLRFDGRLRLDLALEHGDGERAVLPLECHLDQRRRRVLGVDPRRAVPAGEEAQGGDEGALHGASVMCAH